MKTIKFPPEYIREMSMQSFEIVITHLKEKGCEFEKLAEAADAAFLLWQLADDERMVAQQTIHENLPILIDLIYRSEDG